MQRIIRLVSFGIVGLSVFLTGCSSTAERDYPAAVVRFLVEATGDDAGVNVQLPISQVTVRVSPKAMITEYDIVSAQLVQSDLGPAVMFQLNQQAGRDLFRLSATNQGSRLVTTINGAAVGARRMDRPIGDSVIISFIEIPAEDLPELVTNINKTSTDLQKDLAKRKK